MSQPIIDAPCPLCGTSGQYQHDAYNQRKHYRCAVCDEFVITELAERRLAQGPDAWREGYSAKAAQAPEGKILVISRAPLTPDDGSAKPVLEGKLLERAEVIR